VASPAGTTPQSIDLNSDVAAPRDRRWLDEPWEVAR
jgi:hypothetical protein